MFRRYVWFLLLSAVSGLLSCATLSPPPQPGTSQPHARIVLYALSISLGWIRRRLIWCTYRTSSHARNP